MVLKFINGLHIAQFGGPFPNFILLGLLAEFGTGYQSLIKILSPSGFQKPGTLDFVQKGWSPFLIFWQKFGEIPDSVLKHLHFTDFLGDVFH